MFINFKALNPYKWKRENPELFNLYINCHQDKAVAMEQEMDLYKEMLLSKEIDPSTYNVLVQTLKWKMAKFYPKVFGEKVDVTSDQEKIQSGFPTLEQFYGRKMGKSDE